MPYTDEELYNFIRNLANTNPRASAFRNKPTIFDFISNIMEGRNIHQYERAVLDAMKQRTALDGADKRIFEESTCQCIKFQAPSGKETNLAEAVAFHRSLEADGLFRDGRQRDLAREWLKRCKEKGWF